MKDHRFEMDERRRHPSRALQAVPAPETPLDTPALTDLRRGPLRELVSGLKPWQKMVVGAVLSASIGNGIGGISGLGFAKALGVQTTVQAKVDKAEIIKVAQDGDANLLALIQGMRTEGVSPVAMVTITKEIEAAVSRASLARVHKKTKPVNSRPAPTEDEP